MRAHYLVLAIVCFCVVGIVISCTLATCSEDYSYKQDLSQAIERLARESDRSLGW